jgi:hypothetical protein
MSKVSLTRLPLCNGIQHREYGLDLLGLEQSCLHDRVEQGNHTGSPRHIMAAVPSALMRCPQSLFHLLFSGALL